MGDLAAAINQVEADLANAVEADEGPDRTKNIGIAARLCLGLPRLIFRLTDGREERKHAPLPALVRPYQASPI